MGARLEAVVTTAAMNEAAKSAWCREHGMYPAELDKWRASCTTALADPEDARASPQATRASAVTSRRNPATRSRHIPASWRGAEERLEALF